MKILWINDHPIHRAQLETPVWIMTKQWGGALVPTKIKDLGYVQKYRHRDEYAGQTYGSVNQDDHGACFYNIDNAKAYVEQQALVGLAINKLTR